MLSALREFRRVTKPADLVASKEIDLGLLLFAPLAPHLFPRLLAARGWSNLVRARGQRRWLQQAGLVDVWQRTTLIERWAPLTPTARAFLAETVGGFAYLASQRDGGYRSETRRPGARSRAIPARSYPSTAALTVAAADLTRE